MKSNHVLAALAVLVLGGSVWLAFSFFGPRGSTALEKGLTRELVRPETEVQLASGGPQEQDARAAVQHAPAGAASMGAAAVDGAVELGGVIGRVVEEDGAPVAGISVALVQVDANLLLAADWERLGESPPELVVERTLTSDDGRFRLDGAYDASFQGLGVDLGGPRSTLRVVDMQLHHGAVTDFGDIVLRAGCTISGRVVDEGGEPVPGARVRIFPAPPGEDLSEFLQAGVQDFRADCSIGISRMIHGDVDSPVVELPALVRNHLDDLPLPTTHTNADGEYRFEGAPIGKVFQGVDKPDWVGVSRIVTTTAGEVALEDARLSVGRTIQGIVVDEEGNPLEGIEVIAGSEFVFGEAAILHPAGITGADGRFSLRGCPQTGNAMACARRHPDEPWVGVLEPGALELEIELESAISVTVHLVDAAGESVGGARVELAPGADNDSPMGMLGRFAFLGAAAPPRTARFQQNEAGAYVCAGVTPGRYEVTARPPGFATARQQVELWEGKAELTIVCEQGRSLDLTVVDARTGDGIPGARASVIGPGFPFFAALAVGRSGANGRVRLGPFSLTEDAGGVFGFGMSGAHVLVQHARYADASMPLEDGTLAAEIALARGGEIRGQIVWGADPPQSVYMVLLENEKGGQEVMKVFLPPRIGRSDLSGAFHFTNLPAGTYSLAVFDRFLDGDPVLLMMDQKEPTMVHREDGVELEPGGSAEVVIDLSPSGRGQTARIVGSVYLDMAPLAGARVRVSGRGPSVWVDADALGNFETPDFLALGKVRVQVDGNIETEGGELERVSLHEESLTIRPHTVHRLDLDLRSQQLRVLVTSAAGAPAVGAQVQLRAARGGGRGSTVTDELGRAQLALIGDAPAVVTVSLAGYAKSSVDVDPRAADFAGELEVVLRGATPCAGICDVSALGHVDAGQDAYLRVTGEVDSDWVPLASQELAGDGLAPFRIEGLLPGSYSATLWFVDGQAEAISFELPERGDENLFFAFRPPE